MGHAHEQHPHAGPSPAAEQHGLQPGARALLDAARELLIEGGFDALRIEAIARRAGVNKAMIRYYFGDKAGLVAALVDDLLHDATVNLVAASEAAAQKDGGLHEYVAGTRRLMETPGFLAFFDVLPHALRSPVLRRRIADLYVWYREMNLRCFDACLASPVTDPGEKSARGGDSDARRAAVAALVVAAVDGLAVQAALGSDDIDLDACFDALEEAVGVLLPGVDDVDVHHSPDVRTAAGSGSGASSRG